MPTCTNGTSLSRLTIGCPNYFTKCGYCRTTSSVSNSCCWQPRIFINYNNCFSTSKVIIQQIQIHVLNFLNIYFVYFVFAKWFCLFKKSFLILSRWVVLEFLFRNIKQYDSLCLYRICDLVPLAIYLLWF